MKAKPVPHWGVPVALPQANKRSTVPEPFSFEGLYYDLLFIVKG